MDWWTLGVFIYELISGYSPFDNDDPMIMYNNIIERKFKFTKNFDKISRNLIKNLLEVDLSRRYGNMINGVNDIKNHQFFKEINFEKMKNMELKPPYIPRVTNPCDLSNFSSYPDSNSEVKSIDTTTDPFISW